MAAPEYVPLSPTDKTRVYQSPPWSGDQWLADRPGELGGRQPLGPRLGYPGPDQGFVLKLAHAFEPTLVLVDGETVDDVIAGCGAVALKRASLFGRAPGGPRPDRRLHDLGLPGRGRRRAGAAAPPLFEEVANPHHYMELRRVADLVPQAVLRLTAAPRSRQLIDQGPARREKFFKRAAQRTAAP